MAYKVELKHGDRVVIIHEATGFRSVVGGVFEIDLGVVDIRIKGHQMTVAEDMTVETVLGQCRVELVGREGGCPKCHNVNQEGAKFCSKCGSEL